MKVGHFMKAAVSWDDFDHLAEMFDDAVDAWHEGKIDDAEHVELHAFLGMTREQYKLVAEQPGKLLEVVREHRAKLVGEAPGPPLPIIRESNDGELWRLEHARAEELEGENASLRTENAKLKAERDELHRRLREMLARLEGQ